MFYLITIVGIITVLSSVSYATIRLFRSWALHNHVLIDQPNARSSHHVATVRGGGVVFAGMALISWLIASYIFDISYGLELAAGAAIVALVGFADDAFRIGITLRLCAQFIAGCVFLSAIPEPVFFQDFAGGLGAPLWYCLAAFFLVSVTNIYNFMDGADGLAALHSVVLLCGWSFLTFQSDSPGMFAMSISLLAPLLGFLVLNWHPAKIFMGDVGSTFLGFTFGAFAIIQFPGLLRSATFGTVILLMLPFLFDASFTILHRMLSGERWYLAHKDHLFQRLLHKGYSHPQVALAYAALTLALGIVGLLSDRIGMNEWVAIFLVCLPIVGMYLWAGGRSANVERKIEIESAPALRWYSLNHGHKQSEIINSTEDSRVAKSSRRAL